MSNLVAQPALDRAMKEVLERMFFLEASTASSPAPPGADPGVEVRLTFEGEPSGSLRLRVTTGAARAISADFLGIDESHLSERQIGEVICELANMVCGSALSSLESAATFRLGAPQVESFAQPLCGTDTGETDATTHSVETANGIFTAILTTPQDGAIPQQIAAPPYGATEDSACPAAEKSVS